MCGYVPMRVKVPQKARGIRSLKLELQAVNNCLMWMRTELKSSERAVRYFNL